MFLLVIIFILFLTSIKADCDVNIAAVNSNDINGTNIPISIGTNTGIFGEQFTYNLRPNIGVKASSGFTSNIQTFERVGATITLDTNNAIYDLETSTSTTSAAIVRTRSTHQYLPGVSNRALISVGFDVDATSGYQYAGVISFGDSLTIAYVEDKFQCLYRSFGQVAMAKLVITTAGSIGDNVTISISDVDYLITLETDTIEENASEIEIKLYELVSRWNFASNSDYVYLMAASINTLVSSYDLSYTGDFVGTLTTIHDQRYPEAVAVLEADFLTDTSWLNQSSLNVYQIDYAFLGAATLKISVYNPYSLSFQPLCIFPTGNSRRQGNFRDPNLRLGWIINNGGVGNSLKMIGASGQTGYVGDTGNSFIYPYSSYNRLIVNVPTADFTYYYSIRNKRMTFEGILNSGLLELDSMDLATLSNRGAEFKLILNCELEATPVWNDVDSGSSMVEVDLVGSGCVDDTGTEIFSVGMGRYATITKDFSHRKVTIVPSDVLTVVGKSITNAEDGSASISWKEIN